MGGDAVCYKIVLFTKSDIKIRQVLFPILLIKGSNHRETSGIGQSERCRRLLEHGNTSHLFEDPWEIGRS